MTILLSKLTANEEDVDGEEEEGKEEGGEGKEEEEEDMIGPAEDFF